MRSSNTVRILLGVACLGALAPLAAGCGGDDLVHLRGHVYHADGTPAAGLALYSGALLGDDGVLAAQTTTDANGAYELVGTPQPYAASAAAFIDVGIGDGLLARVLVHHRSDTIDVPDVQLWDDALTLTEDPAGGGSLTWNDPPAGFTPIQLVAGDPGDGGFVESWREPVIGTRFVLAGEMLEDRAAAIVVEAGLPVGQPCAQEVCITLRSHLVRTSGPGSVAPVSRLATCAATTAHGTSTPLTTGSGAPCPLTDGIFATPFAPQPEWSCGTKACEPLTAVTVDLAETTEIHKVVLRAVDMVESAFLDVEVSSDGASFTGIERISAPLIGSYVDLVLDAPVTARYVRLSVPAGAILGLAELSVF